MSEMQYRTVTLTARVYSGSDDHAKHEMFWAFNRSGVMFVDDYATQIHKILEAVVEGNLTNEHADWAADLLRYGLEPLPSAFVDELKVEEKK